MLCLDKMGHYKTSGNRKANNNIVSAVSQGFVQNSFIEKITELDEEKIKVEILSDCITSYDKRKIDEMLRYYESKGSKIISLNDLLPNHIFEAQKTL